MQLEDRAQRGFAFTAAGVAARLNGALTPELYAALREERLRGLAEYPIKDTLTFVPFKDLPRWFKWCSVRLSVYNKVEGWWYRSQEAIGDAWRALCGRRS
jgi:hypothetical protein